MRELAREGRYAIVYHEHPGYREDYDYDNDVRVGAGYAATINSSGLASATRSLAGMSWPNIFEIPASGALLVADGLVSGPLRELGFIENIHYLPVAFKNLDESIRYALDNANSIEIDESRRRGQELVLRSHPTSDRARMIDEVC